MLILAPFLAVGKNKPKVVLQKCDSIVPLIRWPDCIMGGLRGLQINLFFDDVLGKKKISNELRYKLRPVVNSNRKFYCI